MDGEWLRFERANMPTAEQADILETLGWRIQRNTCRQTWAGIPPVCSEKPRRKSLRINSRYPKSIKLGLGNYDAPAATNFFEKLLALLAVQ
jgi:hypothetical protein